MTALARWITPLGALLLAGCPTSAEQLAGDYHSTWGLCVLEVRGPTATIRYPRGVMNCQVEAPLTFRCGWQSGTARGKALLRAQEDRTLRGTWGRGESDSDGGAWVMARSGG